MSKCGSCGQFMTKEKKDGVSCTKCLVVFHRVCVKISETGKVSSNWTCTGCKSRPPKNDKSSTPARGPGGDEFEAPKSTKSESEEFPPDGLAQEIRFLRIELKATRAEMQEGLREVRSEIADFKSALSSCTDRLDAMELRLTCLETKYEEKVSEISTDAVQDTIFELKTQLNERDQEILLNDVEISGIPEGKEETPLHLIKVLSAKLGVSIGEQDIVHVERFGPIRQNRLEDGGTGAPRPRPITVRLTRRCTRDQLIRAARVRRSITTSELDLNGAPRRVYVNERLTRQNRQLFYKAREEARRQGYKYVWTREGKIFARKEDGKPAQRIRSEKDISRIFG